MDELFEWDLTAGHGRSNVYVFGKRVAQRVNESGSLRTASSPLALPGGFTPWQGLGAILVLSALGLLAGLLVSGSLGGVPELGRAFVSVVTAGAALLLPTAGWTTTPPGGGNSYFRWYANSR